MTTIPKYVYRNLNKFHNCSLPIKLVDEIGIDKLEKELNCRIERREVSHTRSYVQSEMDIFYIATANREEN